ncbi:MAG: UDP-2,3-diacylglucosamine diphosphatase [Balneolales bacterium]
MTELFKIAPEPRYLFISDVHLGGFSPEKNREIETDLLSMIDYAESMKMEIIILGDLFDYWMEYPDRPPRVAPSVLERFAALHKKKPGTLFITGNHDNWTGSYLKDIGFDIEHEYRMFDLDNNRIFLMHGDGLSDQVFGLPRPFFHRLIRNVYFVSLYKKILPARSGIGLMRLYSRINRQLKAAFKPGNPRLDSWAVHHLKEKADTVICGHHHKPLFSAFGNKVYMNLGNFFNDRTAGIYANKSFYLVTWDGDSNTFTTLNSTHFSH